MGLARLERWPAKSAVNFVRGKSDQCGASGVGLLRGVAVAVRARFSYCISTLESRLIVASCSTLASAVSLVVASLIGVDHWILEADDQALAVVSLVFPVRWVGPKA